MSTLSEKWRLRFDECRLELSARRLWEHVELGQINPFPSITPASAAEPQLCGHCRRCRSRPDADWSHIG